MHPIKNIRLLMRFKKGVFRLEQLKLLHIYLISRCYDISIVLFDTNMKRLYMCTRPGQHGWPPHKKSHGRQHSFHKIRRFLYDFSVGRWLVSLWAGICIAVLVLNTYMGIFEY